MSSGECSSDEASNFDETLCPVTGKSYTVLCSYRVNVAENFFGPYFSPSLSMVKPKGSTGTSHSLVLRLHAFHTGVVMVEHDDLDAITKELERHARDLNMMFAVQKYPNGYRVVWVHGQHDRHGWSFPSCDAVHLCKQLRGNMVYTATALRNREYCVDVCQTSCSEGSFYVLVGDKSKCFDSCKYLNDLMDSIHGMEYAFGSGKLFPSIFMENALMRNERDTGEVCPTQEGRMLMNWFEGIVGSVKWGDHEAEKFFARQKINDQMLPLWSEECEHPVMSPLTAVAIELPHDLCSNASTFHQFENQWLKVAQQIGIGAMERDVPCVGIWFSCTKDKFVLIGLDTKAGKRGVYEMRCALEQAFEEIRPTLPADKEWKVLLDVAEIDMLFRSNNFECDSLSSHFGRWMGEVSRCEIRPYVCRTIREPWIRNWLLENAYNQDGLVKENVDNLLQLAKKWQYQEQQRAGEAEVDLSNRKRTASEQQEEPAEKRSKTEP